jgi:preprotein translocase subunit SecE
MAEMKKGSKLKNIGLRLVKFFKEVRSELKKVVWPTRKQLINNTLTVLLSCLIIGAIIWAADIGLAKIVDMVYLKT